MRNPIRALRRTAVVAVALAAFTTVAVPSAHAAYDACGPNQLDDGVYMRACWLVVDENNDRVNEYYPEAKIRIPFPLDPNKWSSCEVRTALFTKRPDETVFQKRGLRVSEPNECLSLFRWQSTNNSHASWWDHDGFFVLRPQPGYCYKPVTAWHGVYDGVAVGSGSNNAEGPVICGASGVPDTSAVLGDGVVDVAAETPMVPRLTIE